MTERDQNKKLDINNLGQHRDSTNLEENPDGKNEPKVSHGNYRKEESPQFTSSITCSICSKTFTEIRHLIEHLHLHEREQHSEQKTARDQPNSDVNRNDTKDECFEKREAGEHHPIINISSKCKKYKTQSTRSTQARKKRLKCQICEKTFGYLSLLRQHAETHTGEASYSRPKRGKDSRQKSDAKQRIPTQSDVISCPILSKALKKKECLTLHLRNHDTLKKRKQKVLEANNQVSNAKEYPESTENLVCEVNPEIFAPEDVLKHACTPENRLNEFAATANKKNTIQTSINTSNAERKANRRQRHFEERRFKCNVCAKSFLRSSTLKKHLLLHSDETSFSCEDCGVSFSHQRDLTRHLTGISLIHLTDTGKTKNPCRIILNTCVEKGSENAVSKKSSESENLLPKVEEETSLQHPPSKDTFSCKVCQKEFVGEKPAACDKCQTELPGESCLDVTAISVPNESVEKSSRNVCSDKVAFKCFFCPKSFSRINCLQVHVLCHSAEKVSCGLCGSVFKSARNLAKHLHSHVGEKSHKCERCGKSFLTRFYLEAHLRVHSDERPYLCEICGKSYRKKFDLNIHLQIHSNEKCPQSVKKPFECEICRKRFFARSLLKKHRCEASSSQELQGKCSCKVCGKEMLKGSLKRHLLSHSEGKPFNCEVCQKSFKSKDALTSHLQGHSGEKPFPCDICGKKFSSKKMLKNHGRYHSDTRSFACEFCPKTFGIKSTLRTHLRIHTGEKPFTCDICQRSFRQSGSMHMHRRIHEGVKAFVCEQCSKGFYSSSDLKRHRVICSGEERPFECEICQKTFRYVSHLTEHRRHHTGEKPYVCKVCDKSFRLCASLQRHKRVHTGERPYKCDVCQKGFIQQYNLKIHLRTHNREASVSSDLSNNTNDPVAPTSSGLSDGTRGLGVPVSSKTSDNSHVRDARTSHFSSDCPRALEVSMPSDLLNNTDGRHASLHSGVPHCTQSLDAPTPTVLPNQTHCLDGHMPSGLSNQQVSGQIPNFLHTQSVEQNWYY